MYSKEETRELQKLSAELLKKHAKTTDKKDLEKLRSVLRFHEHRYYILNDPLIADAEYDQLYKALEKIEAEGGKILMEKTSISPEIGYMAFFEDTEGNRIAIHSQQ